MVLYREDWKRERNARVAAVKRKNVAEKRVKEYCTELESILDEYAEATAELQRTKKEKENLQQILIKSAQTLNQQRELLEMQRNEVQDKLSHMTIQVGGQ